MRFTLFCLLILISCSQNRGIESSGVSFSATKGEFTKDHSSTGGISLIDIDNDLDLDVYVTNGYDVSADEAIPQKNRLYINDGKGHLSIDKESVLSNDSLFSSGSSWADYNNDGFVDVFISNQRAQNNTLFKGTGKGFIKVDNITSNDQGYSYSANWVDIDLDGDVDLYVANGGLSHSQEDYLYRNDEGDVFTRIISTPVTRDTIATIGGLWRDFNQDGYPDLFASYRLAIDRVYINKGNWEFEEVLLDSPVKERYAFPKSAGTVADIDNDGDLDIYQTSLMGGANFLFINDGDGSFTFKEAGALTSAGGHTYGAAFSDFNNDGVKEAITANWGSSVQLFIRNESTYVWVNESSLSEQILYASSISVGDVNGDGKQDVFIPQWPNSRGDFESNLFYINTTRETGNWVKIKLTGTHSNRSALGAGVKINCRQKKGDLTLFESLSSQKSWRSQSGLILFFGVGDCEYLERIEVKWPSLKTSILHDISVNQLLEIEEPGN